MLLSGECLSKQHKAPHWSTNVCFRSCQVVFFYDFTAANTLCVLALIKLSFLKRSFTNFI